MEALRQLPLGFEHEIDFTKYHPNAVYYSMYSSVYLKRLSDMGRNESLFKSFKKYFAEQYKDTASGFKLN